jgi:hypothetical protein
LDVLRQFGRDIQINNSYLSGLKSGASSINAERVNAQIISVGNEVISGFAARFYADVDIPNATYTDTPSWSETYNDGFNVSGDTIVIPFTGRYIVSFQVSWNNGVSSSGVRDTGATKNGVPDRPQDNQNGTGGAYTYLNVYDEIGYNKGDEIKFTHYQNSGSTINMRMWVVFRLMRLGA